MLQKCVLKFWGPMWSNACAIQISLISWDSWNPSFWKASCFRNSFWKSSTKVNYAQFWSTIGQTWSSGPQNFAELTLNFLLIFLISSLFCWIFNFFNILLYTSLHHISSVLPFDFAPEGQDDYIIELNFNSFWVSLLGASGSHLMFSLLGHLN